MSGVKPVYLVFVVLAGVLGGAFIMRIVDMTRPAVPQPVAAQSTPPPTPAIPPAAGQSKPSPLTTTEERRAAPRPLRFHKEDTAPEKETAPPVPQPSMTSGPTVGPPPVRVVPEPAPPVTPAPRPHQVTLNAGMLLPVRLADTLIAGRSAPDDTFLATLDRELSVDGQVIAERGARVEGKVVAAGSAITVTLTHLYTNDGQIVPIQTDTVTRVAASLPTGTPMIMKLKTPAEFTDRMRPGR